MITYQTSLENYKAENFGGFFVGWPNQPSKETLFEILKNSNHIVLAVDIETERVVGFTNAISDKILSAYIPLLEVLPNFQNRGIGKELTTRMFTILNDYYMVDICCDDGLVPFYEKFDCTKINGMVIRNYFSLKKTLKVNYFFEKNQLRIFVYKFNSNCL